MTAQNYSHWKEQTETTVKVAEMGEMKCPKGEIFISLRYNLLCLKFFCCQFLLKSFLMHITKLLGMQFFFF